MPDANIENKPLLNSSTVLSLRNAVLAHLGERPFAPPAFLANPHFQTVGGRYLRRLAVPKTRLERWTTPDDDFLRVHTIEGDTDKPLVLLSHGLEGSIESPYILTALAEFGKIGWSVVVFEHRSCGGEMNRAQRMYHSGETTDLAFVVDGLMQRYPGRPIYIAGYSLGGNQLAKWFGESGDAIPEQVRAAAVVSAPFDLVESQRYIDSGIRRGYVLHFLRWLVPKALEKAEAYPGILDIERIKKVRRFVDFDEFATAPLHGFENAHDYYTRVACGQFLPGIRRPTMILSSADDPFNPGHTIPWTAFDANPYLIPQITDVGGHVGFVRSDPEARVGYWAEEQIVRFFQAIHDSS